jgi:hypothetical protein
MIDEPDENPPHMLRRMWRVFGVIAAIVLLGVLFIMWSRWQEDQDFAAKQKAAQAAQQRDADAKSFEVLGGSEFKIIGFYATPGTIHRGDTVDMCYGVSNAKSVKLDPPEATVWPSVDRCMQVTPQKTTKYTFTADDGKGNTKTAELTIEVK